MARSVIGAVAAADVTGGVIRALAAADLTRGVDRALAAADLARGRNRRGANGRCCMVGAVVVPVVTGSVVGAVTTPDMTGRVVGAVRGDGNAAARYRRDRDCGR